MRTFRSLLGILTLGVVLVSGAGHLPASEAEAPVKRTYVTAPPAPFQQDPAAAAAKSAGCVSCHAPMDLTSMHESPAVHLGCVDCHGGDPTPGLTMRKAHIVPRNPEHWPSSANPADASVLLNHESPEFIQFINPGDLRVSAKACGPCHAEINTQVGHSIMRHGAMLWGSRTL